MNAAPTSVQGSGPTVTGFGRVVVGIDGSPESVEAARQGVRLAAEGAPVRLLAAYDLPLPVVGIAGPAVPPTADDEAARDTAAEFLREAVAAVPAGGIESAVARGNAADRLVEACGDGPGGLIAVGSHGVGRLAGILIGSTATELVHEAPTSVLVARHAGNGFPRKIVVGVDGSPESAVAYSVAKGLAERFGATLWPAIAHGGDPVDMEAATAIVGHRHDDMPDEPAQALKSVAAEADLLVVGSRGLHGLRALGSVSERVAHEARCSVLVVRNV